MHLLCDLLNKKTFLVRTPTNLLHPPTNPQHPLTPRTNGVNCLREAKEGPRPVEVQGEHIPFHTPSQALINILSHHLIPSLTHTPTLALTPTHTHTHTLSLTHNEQPQELVGVDLVIALTPTRTLAFSSLTPTHTHPPTHPLTHTLSLTHNEQSQGPVGVDLGIAMVVIEEGTEEGMVGVDLEVGVFYVGVTHLPYIIVHPQISLSSLPHLIFIIVYHDHLLSSSSLSSLISRGFTHTYIHTLCPMFIRWGWWG